MATCPNCGVSSRVEHDAISVENILVARPIGTWSVAGQQLKTSATAVMRMSCECGWSIDGYVQGEEFYGYPKTQVFPSSEERPGHQPK